MVFLPINYSTGGTGSPITNVTLVGVIKSCICFLISVLILSRIERLFEMIKAREFGSCSSWDNASAAAIEIFVILLVTIITSLGPAGKSIATSLEQRFDQMWEAAGCNGLKGHRSVGGYRASMYNALTLDSVQVLVEIMQELEKKG